MTERAKTRQRQRYYTKLAKLLPEFSAAASRPLGQVIRQVDETRRGYISTSRRVKTPELEPMKEVLPDYDYERVLTMTQNSRNINPVLVPQILQPAQRIFIPEDQEFIHILDEEEDLAPEEEDISIFANTTQNPIFRQTHKVNSSASEHQSQANSARSGGINTYSSKFFDESDSDDEISRKNVIKIDKTGFPEIPPLATDLVQLIETIPDSAPASLSPYTFAEEVVGLNDDDFMQFLDEDTLFIKSALFGGRFNDDSIYELFNSLSDSKHQIASNIVIQQYFKIGIVANAVRDLLQYGNAPDAAYHIEQDLQDIFNVKTAMVWINIPSAKMLINHSRLMRYPHGKGFVGTAASEKRQVIAPNPTRSPIYSEEYDLPFCEECELIVAKPIIDPSTDELYAVLLLIDKQDPSGAFYSYWPQSELTLLNFYIDGCHRVFKRIIQRFTHTEKLYKIIAKFVANQFNLFKLIQSITSYLSGMLQCETTQIYFDEGKDRLYSFDIKHTQIQKTTVPLKKAGIAGYIFEKKELVNASNASLHPSYFSNIDGAFGTRPIIGIPLITGDTCFAVIVCRGKQGLCFTTDDVNTLTFLSSGAAPALQMSMTYRTKTQELNIALRAQDRLAALLQVAESLSRETNIDTLVSQILVKACQLVSADRASLFVLDDSKNNLISKVAHGTDKPFVLPVGQGIVGTVARTGETINIPDCYEDSRFNSAIDKKTGYRTKSMMTIPVHDQRHSIIGVVQLMNKQNGEAFSDADVELTKAMCVFTGIALANSIVIDSAFASSQRVQAMLKTVSMLTHGEALSGLLHHIMSTSRDLIDADRCSLFILDTNSSKLSSTVSDGQKAGIEITKGKGIAGYVAEKGESLNIPDAYKDPRFHRGVDNDTGYRTRSILAVPIKNNSNETIGVVELINKDIIKNGGVFTKEDEKLTSGFATFAGVAFDQHSDNNRSGSHTLAIMLSNMMNAEEANSFSPPKQIALNEEQMTRFDTFRFDVATVSEIDSARFIMTIFYKLGLSQRFKINNSRLIRFILAVHDGYMKSPFYNWQRAVASAQFVYYILTTTDLKNILTDLEKLALIVSTICHDIDYTSVDDSNQSTEIALAVLYHNRPVMEMHHCEHTISILERSEENILETLNADDSQSCWKMIISLILGTNMAKHFNTVTTLQSLIFPNKMINMKLEEHRLLIMQFIIKASDASYACRNFPVCQREGTKAYKMFTDKTAIGKLFQRYLVNSQVGFIILYAEPMFTLLTHVFPSVDPLLEQVKLNLQYWKQLKKDG
ncbi:GAF domain containing protein [Trichomonas vaginalis G3]|uniref:GAF domain containing protein n=1 Tax=Trichomonas vaginalis (strain ATCC PRA-98 / G3) TaxID=412133 RepID=A2E5S0_TRIV3|nr:cyclic nucleotide phosphodiesterase family [Trichomonas vaginalis G3]EAY11990.1 GAF domain containing protein [Trichomonas vaginalis G3]KAI5524835.1 cyclic nucleotide phosphodiesterase family [Trichomonas vaginalis G3]|eukprot:XP_001324213.1 GAF domain containing protein [Trichomonas vaginalis G3]